MGLSLAWNRRASWALIVTLSLSAAGISTAAMPYQDALQPSTPAAPSSSTAQPSSQLPTKPVIDRRPNGTPIVTSQNFRDIDYAAEIQGLVERHQPITRPDDESSNGWSGLVEACVVYRQSVERFKQSHGLTGPELLLDFDAIYLPNTADDDLARERREKERANAIELLQGGLIEDLAPHLERIRNAPRFVRWKLASDAFRDALEKQGIAQSDKATTALIFLQFPEVGGARALTRISAARMKLATDAGDWKTVAESFENMLALSRAMGSQHSNIDYIVSVAIQSLCVERLMLILTMKDVPASCIEACQAAMDRQLILPLSMEHMFQGERLLMMDVCGKVYGPDGSIQAEALTEIAGNDDARLNAMLSAWPDPDWTISRFNLIFDDFIDFSNKPYAQQRDVRTALDVLDDGFDLRDTLPKVLLPSLRKPLQTTLAVRGKVAALRAVIAIELARLKTGSLPASWDDIERLGIRCDQAIDPYSLERLRFVRSSTPDARPGYTLYSVGIDLQDDQGTECPPRGNNSAKKPPEPCDEVYIRAAKP